MMEPGARSQPLKASEYGRGCDEEKIELVISPPFVPTQLLRCIGQLDRILRESNSYSSITRSVNSFAKGITVVLQMQPDKLSDLIIRLAYLPEVERIVEDISSTGASSTGSGPNRKFRVILKELQIAGQESQELVAVAA